uniref:S8 family serine peptidase n=1 Tax=Shewanella sp. TaxID=50422 RepID=UPI0040483840
NDADASDGASGHGTHVSGIISSSDANYPGIAPGVNIIALRVLSDKGGTNADILEAINWVVANSARYNVVAVNLSLGNGTFDKVPTAETPIQGVSYPSSDPHSLSVGAVWASAGKLGSLQVGSTDAIVAFSQRDNTESDIFAPGAFVTAARNGGGVCSEGGYKHGSARDCGDGCACPATRPARTSASPFF